VHFVICITFLPLFKRIVLYIIFLFYNIPYSFIYLFLYYYCGFRDSVLLCSLGWPPAQFRECSDHRHTSLHLAPFLCVCDGGSHKPQGFALAKQCSATWASPSAHFALVILEIGGGGAVLWTLCPGWPWTEILLISAFQIAGITGVSHRRPASIFFLIAYIEFHYVAVTIILLVCFFF
jgi:hypothetical protein